ncbi:MAG: hypothetical protein ACXVIY_11400 [Mucilaginibacter sp.]
MKRKALITIALSCCFIVCLAAITGLTGKWKASLKDPEGNDHQFHLSLNADGEKLTGTAQAEGDPLNIQEGKVTGDDFAFKLTDPEGNVIPVNGKYVTQGDSISLNFEQSGTKFHLTFTRDDK